MVEPHRENELLACLGLPNSNQGLRAEHCEFGGGDNDCGEARILNSGQSCIAVKPFIVTDAIADKLERLFAEKMAGLKVGDPFYEKTELGREFTNIGGD